MYLFHHFRKHERKRDAISKHLSSLNVELKQKIINYNFIRGQYVQQSPLAQLVERETVNLEAVGSIPTWRDNFVAHARKCDHDGNTFSR